MKTNENFKKDLWDSIEEKDVMQLREQLHEVRIIIENHLQSYSMNSSDENDFM